uniref:DDB1- and CUL4-associated factor 15 WD40 repeat-containing domain-containing protein n=1 Tax=Anopheles dirus TaxID=7168 RepID=A0A182NG50_9DIPT
MSSYHLSTRERLLTIVNDIEIVAKELIENTIAPKAQKMSSADHAQLVELLVLKDKELKSTLQLAAEQAGIEKNMDALREQVRKQDEEINQLQKQLKEAEQILATSIFQARQKLASIAKANKRPVSSEELIKFAHRISASHAICAPLTWQQGDLRRPYPTDIEMRLGLLGKSDLNINGHNLQHPSSLNEMHRNASSVTGAAGGAGGEIPASAQNQFAWHPSGELHMSMGAGGGSVSLDTRAHKDASQDDVEVISAMDPNRSVIGEEVDRIIQMQRLRASDGHRFFTRANSSNGTQNILLKVLSREHSGYLASGLNRRSRQQPFQEVPEQLQFCLKSIVPYCYLNGHIFMGLTSCGQFLLSYKLSYELDEVFANDFSSLHKYELYFWIYRPHMLLNKYFHVCLFDDHGVDGIKSVSITQWKTEGQLLIVHGGNLKDDADSYVTIVRVPKLGCLDCKQVRDAHEGDEQRQDILCISCNMTIHMKYRSTDSGPRFNPNFNLNCPGFVIMSENSFIHTINIELDTKRNQAGSNRTATLSSKYLGRVSPQKDVVVVAEEGKKVASRQQESSNSVPAKKYEPEAAKGEVASNALSDPAMSIAEQIIADFAEYETDMYETKCSIRNYPDNFDELIITSPIASGAAMADATTEPTTVAQVRLMNNRNNTNIELRLDGAASGAASSSSTSGTSEEVATVPSRKSFVTRIDLQSGDGSARQDTFGSTRIGGGNHHPLTAVPMLCDMSFTASSSTTAPAPSISSRSPLRRRFDLTESSSYVPNVPLTHQQSASLPLQQCVNNSANGANPVEPDADSAAKAYEFSEDNERCEKISAFRKRRLADKKYEFSEEPTSEENIEPFNRLRNQIRARVTAPGYSASHHHANYADLIPTTHHLHRASPNHGFRSPCGSPVGNRYLRSPPGIRSPSYYRHRSPSAQGGPPGAGSVVLIGGGSAAGTTPGSAAMKQLTKRTVQLDPRDFIQILSPGTGLSGTGTGDQAGSTPDIPKFFLDAIQKINEKKLANEQLQMLLDESNNENNINCDNQLPVKRAGSVEQASKPTAAELPTCTKKIVKIYVEEDDANSVVTTEDDDCISPGYHASLPMEVHGSCYSNMQIISQASFNKLNCPAVVVTQNSFDMEMFSFHVANYICTQDSKKYGILLDSAYELTHVCPLTETITCTTVLQFTANDIGHCKPKSCQNCSSTIDCQTHRKVYQCRSLFTWCITTGEWMILDYGNLSSGPYLEVKKLASNYSRLLKKLRAFTRKLFTSGKGESESDRTYEYLNHLRVLDSDTSKAKRRLTDLDNMIEFYLRLPRRIDDYSDSDTDSYGEEEEEEEEEEDDDDGDSSADDTLVGDASVASDTFR